MALAIAVQPVTGPDRCSVCDAEVVLALDDRDELQVVDRHPTPLGDLEVGSDCWLNGAPLEPGVYRVRLRPEGRPPESPAWRSHAETCTGIGRRGPKGALER